jgi:monovalent cation:H+ antiporter-2, CPA2 family
MIAAVPPHSRYPFGEREQWVALSALPPRNDSEGGNSIDAMAMQARQHGALAATLARMSTSSIDFLAYSDALVVLGTAGVVVPLGHRMKISPVLLYLAMGALLGPFGLGALTHRVPALSWVTIADARNVEGIADLGVVFLLFLIGIELSFQRLRAMRRLVLGLGSAQVLLSWAAISGALILAGVPQRAALVLGSFLALSSTAIALEVLSRQGRMSTGAGRASFAVLMAQDMAAIPILMLASLIGGGGGGSLLASLAQALGQAALMLAAIVLAGRLLLRPLFRMVARTQSQELFIAALLFVIVGTGVAAAAAGLSMALGAFVAGLLLAGTEYRKAIETTIAPFQGLLLGIFFFTVGMNVDPAPLLASPLPVIGAVAGLIAAKAAIVLLAGRVFRLPWPASLETALLLGPAGEFSVVGIGLAGALGIVSPSATGLATAIASLSMATIPLLGMLGRRAATKMEPRKNVDPALSAVPAGQSGHAIVVGHGRVGRVICDMLARHKQAFVAMDSDPDAVARDRARGETVYYGSATDPLFLRACGLMEAKGVIVTIHTRAQIDEIVAAVREMRPDILIVSRARDEDHASHLYEIGVSDAVPETIEASLQLSEAALVGLGVPTGFAIASIHEKRDEFRHQLQNAARAAGISHTRAVRASSTRRPAALR